VEVRQQPGAARAISAKFVDHELDDPDCFMKTVAYSFSTARNVACSFGKLRLKEFLATLELFQECAGRGLPGERHPGDKGGRSR